MQKTKSTFRKAKANKKSEKTSSFAAGADLRLRPESACATGVGLDANAGVDLCHWSGLSTWAMDFRPKV
jgi:diadenosine tetraphosphatase ApaH/serine/threonine PP2A family protein phosphatase